MSDTLNFLETVFYNSGYGSERAAMLLDQISYYRVEATHLNSGNVAKRHFSTLEAAESYVEHYKDKSPMRVFSIKEIRVGTKGRRVGKIFP